MQMKKLIILPAILIFCWCGQSEAQTKPANISAAKVIDVCATLSKDELAKIVGEPISNAKIGEFPAGHPQVKVSQCTYSAAKGAKSLDVLVKHSTRAADSPEAMKKLMIEVGSKVEDVAGVADIAFWSGSQLHAFKGKNLLVQISLLGFKNPKETAIAVAKAVLVKV